jgi:hypothetical protein
MPALLCSFDAQFRIKRVANNGFVAGSIYHSNPCRLTEFWFSSELVRLIPCLLSDCFYANNRSTLTASLPIVSTKNKHKNMKVVDLQNFCL